MSEQPWGTVRLWHPRGCQVTLPVILGTPEEMFRGVAGYFDAGFLADAPGLVPGEMREEVGWVARGTHTGRTGLADVIMFYSTNEGWTRPFLTDYLNTDADRGEFERATGIKPATIPEYIGEGRLERGKNPRTDQLIVKLPRPKVVVMKPNPKYVEAEAVAAKAANKAYKVPKKIFVRWADASPAQAQAQDDHHDDSPAAEPPAAKQAVTPEMEKAIAAWFQWMDKKPSLESLNSAFKSKWETLPDGPVKTAVWEGFRDYAQVSGWQFNNATFEFVSKAKEGAQ